MTAHSTVKHSGGGLRFALTRRQWTQSACSREQAECRWPWVYSLQAASRQQESEDLTMVALLPIHNEDSGGCMADNALQLALRHHWCISSFVDGKLDSPGGPECGWCSWHGHVLEDSSVRSMTIREEIVGGRVAVELAASPLLHSALAAVQPRGTLGPAADKGSLHVTNGVDPFSSLFGLDWSS